MTDDGDSTIQAIHDTFEDVINAGLRRDCVVGASDEEIDAWAAAQGVTGVPASVREILRIIGKRYRPYFSGGTLFALSSSDGGMKLTALECFEEYDGTGEAPADPAGMLVLSVTGGYAFIAIDGADLALDDPPIWVLLEDGTFTKKNERPVTAWFEVVSESVKRLGRELEELRAGGHEDPSWGRYFRSANEVSHDL